MSEPSSKELAAEVFERLPYGLLVIDERGGVAHSNELATRFLPRLGDGAELRCDELFDCRAPGGPCEEECLALRAALSDEPLPEIRIDTAGDAEVTALWVTAAPLEDGTRAVLHLRPGDRRDRRRRSDPHWLKGPDLRVRCFGRTHVDSAEGRLGGRWLQQRPGQLLKYLVCERLRVLHAEEIAEALWPDSGRQGISSVRYFMHQLRQHLEPDRPKGAPSSFVLTVRDGYALDRRRVHIDADAFERLADAGIEASAGPDGRESAREQLRAALALYRGDFLADEPYAEWAYAERDRLRALAARALRCAASLEDDPEAATAHLERLATLEPYDADVHRELLTAWLSLGRRSEAARRYDAYRVRLERDLGVTPDFELAELAI